MKPCVRCGVDERYADGRCAPCARAGNQRWKENNRDRHRSGSLAWQKANVEARRKTAREWGRKNRSVVSGYRREWRKLNPERHAMHEQKRRAKKACSPGSYTVAEWLALCVSYGEVCLRCGASDVSLTVDHVTPLHHGGSNLIDNIQPLCGPCNSTKGTRSEDYRIDWMDTYGRSQALPPAYCEFLGAALLADVAGVAA
jgi:5-methylcytosine-specific restriction endonuclease McrA